MSETSDVQALTLASLGSPHLFKASEGREFIALPTGNGTYRLDQITSPNKADVLMPKVITQHVQMQTSDSLCGYLNRFKNPDSLVFADIDNDTVVGIIDYHDSPLVGPFQARLTLHRATLKIPKSLEWKTWSVASGILKSHTAFATFLEENAEDVVSPRGADLLELCRDLQVLQNVSFGSTVRMGDLTQVNYQKDNDATTKGGVSLPQAIQLSIPVYFGEPPVSVTAFMRRQVEDGKLKLGIQLSRAEQVRQNEFHRIVDAITAEVSLTTLYGTPA
jgi:uncharacterized protein YfdQ (DUF2303 family)